MIIGLKATTLLLLSPILAVRAIPHPTPRPLVIWHGLGDTYNGEGILDFREEIKAIHPGIFIHSVYIDIDVEADRKAGSFGRIDDQLEIVYTQLTTVPELANGFDGIGFSQGGQFLRAYQQIYHSPPMNNLITFGSQHMGVSRIPACRPWDLICRLVRSGARKGVYSEWAQQNLIQAQYFRTPSDYTTYLEQNIWLPYVNNEIATQRNETYAKNLASLSNLVLAIFTEDVTVVPKESGWFGSYPIANTSSTAQFSDDPFATATSDEPPVIIPLPEQDLYKEDWLGLKQLNERGGLVLTSCEGPHMYIVRECWEPLVRKYVGGLQDLNKLTLQDTTQV